MKKYVPDVARHAAMCEANFVRIQRLLGDATEPSYHYSWQDAQNGFIKVDVDVLERFKYTTTIKLTKTLDYMPLQAKSVELIVRLYDDARMAEVVTLSQGQQLAGVYRYPNNQMYQIDEKAQANHFLGEWLSHLLSHGLSQKQWSPS
ncbi:DUF1249 domain-containing protein [Reinekea marina]|uniref:DUF1249 domain-containing protein n=2 Tax=Reinekea marina TaxID=1310421 RepID=A0ABV7WT73_9GAMM|nr:DUF1249 domain-containing protein [Reinekea forsetii]